jgi:hypothetical protein
MQEWREREREREREGDRETTSTSPVMSMIQKYMGAGEASARGSVGGTRTFAGMKGEGGDRRRWRWLV